MSNKPLILLLIVTLIFFNQGCVIKKVVSYNNKKNILSESDLVKVVSENNITDNSFYIKKAVVDYSDSLNNISFLVSIKYDIDGKYLFVARTAAGIELYRLFIDRDTFLINDRLNRQVLKGETAVFQRRFGVEYIKLKYLFGDLVSPADLKSDGLPCSGDKKIFNSYSNGLYDNLEVDCGKEKLTRSVVKNETMKSSITMVYDNFISDKGLYYAEQVNVMMSNGISIALRIESIESPLNEKIEFVPGNNYEIRLLK